MEERKKFLLKHPFFYLLASRDGKSYTFCCKDGEFKNYAKFSQTLSFFEKHSILKNNVCGRKKLIKFTKKGNELYRLFSELNEVLNERINKL